MINSRTSGSGFPMIALACLFTASFAFAQEPPAALPSPAKLTLGEAVSATLSQQPGFQITKQQVLQRQGDLQSASGQFDWTVGSFYSREVSRKPTGLVPFFPQVEQADVAVYSAGVTKQFRNGVSITPQVSVVDARDNLSSPVPVSQSKLSMKITVPLLRGFGTKATAAQEIAARHASEAQENLARYQLEQIVFQTVTAYWNCLAARSNLEIVSDAAKRASQIFGMVDALAKGGELDSATRDQARALVASKQGQREEAELTYFQARQSLGLALGQGPKELLNTPVVADTFPHVVDVATIRPAVNEKYVSEALVRRGDYQASNLSVEAQKALLQQAVSNLKPRLDMEVSAGYAGYDNRADRFRPSYSVSNNLVGGNILAAFTLEWPVANNYARGVVVNQRGRTEEAKLNASQAANGIAANVLVALETLRKTVAEYGLSTEAVVTYQRAVSQTSEKMKAGEASLTELIDMEDRYASARQVQIENIRKYTVTLAQLRLLTGTLSETVDHRAIFEVKNFTSVPFVP
jgi:outer membrane protein TolC